MAATYTVTSTNSEGNLRSVHGTFTTAAGDSTLTLAKSTHGMNYIVDYNVTLDSGGVGTQNPKVTISSGTMTIVFDDTLGYSGKFYVKGK